MQRSNRRRTTLTPGTVDLPRTRRTSAEVTLEKKKKDDAATKKAKARHLAEVRVAELERQAVLAQDGASSGSKRLRKQQAMSASRDVSFLIIDLISCSLNSHTPDASSPPSTSVQ